MKFRLGQTVATREVAETMKESDRFTREIRKAFDRYMRGDWGDLEQEDKDMNDLAITYDNDRILAKYDTCRGYIYIITEWDRSATTLMFCNVY